MTTRADIVAEARRWLTTPFRHQGRVRGVGADCAGLVLGVGLALGLLDDALDYPDDYGHQPTGVQMWEFMNAHFVRRPQRDIQPGRILLFAFTEQPQHLGIATGPGVIHVYAQVRRCVEHGLDAIWLERLRAVYSYRGVSDDG